ncbi:MAG: hypothetical protein LBN29_12145 [Mediterranea sp.]|jgi:GNAT superfamily N-acetyltransferase|nr:hypothetical protein [Mediterranea sp.]
MQTNISYYFRTFEELRTKKQLPFTDKYHILDTINKQGELALFHNPSGHKDKEVCQILAIVNGDVAGCVNCFSSRLSINGIEYHAQSASNLYVQDDYRKFGLGAELLMYIKDLHPTKNVIVAGISQMALPMYRILKYKLLKMPRYIFLRKSRCAVQSVLKNEGKATKATFAITVVLDGLLWIHRSLLALFTKFRNRSITVERAIAIPDNISEMSANDGSSFMEVHDKKWFEWSLNYTLSMDSRNKKDFFLIRKKDKVIGFFMTKIEYNEAAGGGKFKDIYLGSVMEWGVLPDVQLSELDIQLLAIQSFPNDIDGVQIASANDKVQKKLRRLGLFHVGDTYMGFRFQTNKVDGIDDIHKWRMRLATGDTIIN